MSRITDMAEEEALAAEVEQADADEEDLAAAVAIDQEEHEIVVGEAEIKKAERSIQDQRARLAKFLGADMVRYDCLLCSGLGFVPELPPPFTVIEVVPTDEGMALNIKQPGLAQRYPQAPDKGPCPECDATGFVETGSRNPNALTAACSKCSGNGWLQVARDEPPLVFPAPTTATTASLPNGQPMQVPDDAWQRPYGHPHYGVPPSQLGLAGTTS